jgi:O-antigen ligase
MERVRQVTSAMWSIQGYGLVVLVLLSFHPSLFHIQEYTFFTLFFLAVGTAWWEGDAVWVKTSVDVPLALFVGWVLLSVPFATDPGYSFGEWRKLAAEILVFYWALLVVSKQPSKTIIVQRVLLAMVIGTIVLCAYSLHDFMLRGGGWKDRTIRAGVPFPSGGEAAFNWLSTYMVLTIPFLTLLVMWGKQLWQRLASGVVFILALVTAFLSYTRGAWIGIIAELLVFGVMTRRRRAVIGVALASLLIGVVLLGVSRMGYQRSTTESWTLGVRVGVWKLALEEIVAHPLIGVGYGNHTLIMRFQGYPETRDIRLPHNAFVMVAMGSGIPALVFLCWFLVRAGTFLSRRAAREGDWLDYAWGISVSMLVVGYAVRNFFDDLFFAGSSFSLFLMLLAMGVSGKAHRAATAVRNAAATTLQDDSALPTTGNVVGACPTWMRRPS